ncbi:uncharacterized protein STEHIDRAFT_138556 [Stereum hirsutum FP-91666 SS1]|uniref:uncharacterized protein n=1 Tax=Stereum hirsutum (strain FP-91666) TaxID=721885 RepID=UPI000440B5AD|nr:uncharacterized protein STEHIDRAFT_138556 [Stereum hirsutum FP-91666 SS1]EIM88114.1 hypothetical protein STEHIDRAFT_138556 [Stereum hirsutum FP-91666 SS1]
MSRADIMTISGFYCFTDIWLEWEKVLTEEQKEPTKAMFAFETLVHPDHPLRRNGCDGIELSIGTLNNGEARLLYSSAQIDYIRLWLVKTGLTKEMIPLPYNACMLTSSNLQNCAPAIFKTAAELKKATRDIDKNNKRLKKGVALATSLQNRRFNFERIRALWSEKCGSWCAMDFEAYEWEHTTVTEFGWSYVTFVNGEPDEQSGHSIVKENRHLINTRWVQGNRDNYSFGESETIPKKAFAKRINDMIDTLAKNGPVFLIFHDHSQDVKYLRSNYVNAALLGLSYQLPSFCESASSGAKAGQPSLYVVDTADLFAGLEGEGSTQTKGLERICRHLQIPTQYLHNAGNDARFTFLAFRSMAEGGPLDAQREIRWPNHTPAEAVKVEWGKYEADSNASVIDDDELFDHFYSDEPEGE